jgi:hypothetical protein
LSSRHGRPLHREGFRGCWSRRLRRRPGRPRIGSQFRALIGRKATAKRLWGAPRIHGELLKLGITVSERTVSRNLPNRLTAPSQTCCPFLANHIGSLAFTSTVTSSYASSDDDVVDASVLPFAPFRHHGAGGTPSISGHLSIGLLRATAVSWMACRTESTSLPPTHTFELWQGPAEAVGHRSCPGGATDGDPAPQNRTVSDRSLAPSARWSLRTKGTFTRQVLGPSLRSQVVHIAGEPKLPSLRAR